MPSAVIHRQNTARSPFQLGHACNRGRRDRLGIHHGEPGSRWSVTNVTFGEWLVQVPGIAPAYDWQPGTEAPPGVPDPLDQNEDGRLDALAGHANFVAGVVAQGCEHAELTVEVSIRRSSTATRAFRGS